MKGIEKLLRKKHTELPGWVYLLGAGALSVTIFVSEEGELVQNIALGILGSLLCSWLLDRAGGKAKIRKIRAQ